MRLSDEARLNAESRARILDVVVRMLVQERARVAYLCNRYGIDAAEFFDRPAVEEELAPFLAAAAQGEAPPSLSGALDRCAKVRAFHAEHKDHVGDECRDVDKGGDGD